MDYLLNGETTQSIDVLNSFWANQERNKAPIIHSFTLNGSNLTQVLKLKKVMYFEFFVGDNDSLSYCLS